MESTSKGVGDVNSTEKGSGARFNTGKAPFELIPLEIIAQYYDNLSEDFTATSEFDALWALRSLGRWQVTGVNSHLYDALNFLGTGGWPECAQVFDYGKRKYAEWNWAKGMAWSIPLACAARHLIAIMGFEEDDPESRLPHRGHVFCNIVMLLTYAKTFPEGDDRPRCLS